MEAIATRAHERRMETVVASGSTVEAVGGLGAIVLSILGLVGIAPHYMLTISGIALGVALLFEGVAVAAEYSKLVSQTGTGRLATVELGGGLSAESLAGVSAIVLSILALLGIVAPILTSIVSIVLGAGIMFGSGAVVRLNYLRIQNTEEHIMAKDAAHEAMKAAAGAQVLVGVSAVVLGILALLGMATVTLDLAAMLAIGASLILSGTAIAARVVTAFSH